MNPFFLGIVARTMLLLGNGQNMVGSLCLMLMSDGRSFIFEVLPVVSFSYGVEGFPK